MPRGEELVMLTCDIKMLAAILRNWAIDYDTCIRDMPDLIQKKTLILGSRLQLTLETPFDPRILL